MASFLNFDYVTPVAIRNNEPRFITDTQSLRRQSVRTGAQRWELGISFVGGRTDNLHGTFQAHFMAYGMEDPFFLAMPQNTQAEQIYSIGSASNLYVTSARYAGAKSIAVTSTDSFTIPAGWFIKFDNHDKVYMVTEEVNKVGDSDVVVNVPIAPPLTAYVAPTQTITTNKAVDENDVDGVRIKVQHEMSNASVTYESGLQQNLSWSFVESLS